VLFSVLASKIAFPTSKGHRESPEAISRWAFLLSASCSILIVPYSPLVLKEIFRLLSSSIIGATKQDVLTFSLILMMIIGFLWFKHRPLLLFALCSAVVVTLGLNLILWSRLMAYLARNWGGIALQVSGMLFLFGFLLLPALIPKNISRKKRNMSWIAPGTALAPLVTLPKNAQSLMIGACHATKINLPLQPPEVLA
jgi:ABC-type Mn2+/Zn2+ transport system permease subunit